MNFLKSVESPSIEKVENYPSRLVCNEPVSARRISYKGSRYYYYVTEENGQRQASKFHPSVTTLAKTFAGSSEGLNRWYAGHGTYDTAQAHLLERSLYGTFVHVCLAEMLFKLQTSPDEMAEIPLEDLLSNLQAFAKFHQLRADWVRENWQQIVKDLMAFSKFFVQYEVTPLLIETAVFNHSVGYAGTIDLLAEVTTGERYKTGPRAGQLKDAATATRKIWCIDFKTSKAHKVRTEYAVQGELLRRAVEATYSIETEKGIMPVVVDAVKVLAPGNWRKAPTFWLGDCTKSEKLQYINSVLPMAMHDHKGVETAPYKTMLSGALGFGSQAQPQLQPITLGAAVAMYEQGQGDSLGFSPANDALANRALANSLRKAQVVTQPQLPAAAE